MQPLSASRILGAVGILCLSASARTQTPPAPAPAALSPGALAAEPYILKSSSIVNTMNADGTGTRLQTTAIAVQSDSALRELSVLTIYFSSQSEHAEFTYARVVHSDGSVQQTPVADAIEQPAPVTREAPLYSDLETKQLPIKSLRIGDTLEWQARFTVYHPEVPNQFWGQDTFATGAVILDETYELRVPTGLRLTVWTNPAEAATFTESNDAGQHIYRWHHADLNPTVGAAAEARKKVEEKRLKTPEEELDDTRGKLPSFAFTTFPDWAAVGAWYRNLVADRTTPDDAIKAKVAELIAGKTTDLDKAQAIYTFVSSRIRYVGVDFGIGRYQPHTAAEIFANQYGDCKDKHVLLASMLSVINLHADPVLIGAGIRFNTAVPSPAAFNHAITRLSLNGKDVWLDSTAEVGTWGALLKGLRDQDTLIIPPSPPAIVAHTPIDLPYAQNETVAVVGSLDSSLTSESAITLTFHDDSELFLRSVLRSVSPVDYGTFMQRMMAGMGFGGTTSEPEIKHLEDPAQPLVLALHYHRVKEKDWGDNRITAIFQPIDVPAFTPDEPPTSTIQLGSQRTEISTLNMQLPEGWNAELPDAVHAHTPFATCDVTYSFLKDHVLTAERRLTVLETKLPVTDFRRYQSWYDDCGAGSVPYIQLFPAPKVSSVAAAAEPKAPDAAATTATAAGDAAPTIPSDAKAADLIQQAGQSMRSMDLDNARKLLDQAAAINPRQANLWASYGYVAQMLGIQTQVLQDMERELSYHPDEVQYYPWVAQAEASSGNSKAALATLHAWVKFAPVSLEAARALTRQLQSQQRPAEALIEAQDAIDRIQPTGADVTDLQIVAANAQVALGHASQAADTVAPLLKAATDPVQINDIAYILAQGSAHLTEAATAEAKVLEISEAQTMSWTATGDLRQALELQNSIIAAWDTMGWILFHQGKFTEAYGYVNAAIHGINNKEVRDHLTAINAVLRDPVATSTLHADDQKLRTFPLGPSSGHTGVASFTLLLADGKVLDSASEKSGYNETHALPNAEQLLKAANLHALFPPDSHAHLVRTGFVNCHSGICELVLAPFNGPVTISVTNQQGAEIH